MNPKSRMNSTCIVNNVLQQITRKLVLRFPRMNSVVRMDLIRRRVIPCCTRNPAARTKRRRELASPHGSKYRHHALHFFSTEICEI